MSEPFPARCDRCGTTVEVSPPNLPSSGGALSARDDPVAGWQVLGLTCGPCWAVRRTIWTCPHCSDPSYEFVLQCRGCGRAKPGLPPYEPDLDLLAKVERERQREHDALVAEWDREYPGWRTASHRRSEHS